MSNVKKPEIIVFAGPNGSGKSTITRYAKVIEPYINADDIKRTTHCTDLEAAQMAEVMREDAIKEGRSFTFETVLSTDRNLKLLQKAKDTGYFIRCFYVLTASPQINLGRVAVRAAAGGHDVPRDKVISRYHKSLALLPELISICDIVHIYDNSENPYRIFKKRKNEFFSWTNGFWDQNHITELTGINKDQITED